MKAAIRREVMLTRIFGKGVAGICFFGPIVIFLIPYLRQLNNKTKLASNTMGLAGIIGVSTYMVFYIIYEVTKCERECKSLERAVSFWGTAKIIAAKSIVAGGAGILSEIMFFIIYGILQKDFSIIHLEVLGLTVINVVVFSWMGTMIMLITDSMFSSAIIAGIPLLQWTFALAGMLILYAAFILLELLIGYILHILLRKRIKEGLVDWI